MFENSRFSPYSFRMISAARKIRKDPDMRGMLKAVASKPQLLYEINVPMVNIFLHYLTAHIASGLFAVPKPDLLIFPFAANPAPIQ